MIRIGPCAAARYSARSWVRKMSGRRNEKRIERTPSAGLCPSGILTDSGSLSPPRSRVRKVASLPSSAARAEQASRNCSSSLGRSARSRYRNSVRNSPMPWAPKPSARGICPRSSMLACRAMVDPVQGDRWQGVQRGHSLLPPPDRPQVDAAELVGGVAAGIDHHQAPLSVERDLGPPVAARRRRSPPRPRTECRRTWPGWRRASCDRPSR